MSKTYEINLAKYFDALLSSNMYNPIGFIPHQQLPCKEYDIFRIGNSNLNLYLPLACGGGGVLGGSPHLLSSYS